MNFAQVSSEQLERGFGIQAAVVIGALVIVIGVLFKLYLNEKRDKEEQLKIRIEEAKEVNEKITTPMSEQTELSRKIYDILLNSKRGV